MRTATLRPLHAGVLVLVMLLAGCTRLPLPAVVAPAAAEAVVVDRLLFGRNIPGGGTVSDSAWSVFLAEVVTPRLPAGFTTWRTEGQWRGADGTIEREAGFVLEVGHPPGLPPDRVIEAIGIEYCRRFRQEAVMRVRSAAEQWLIRAKAR